MLKKMIKVCVYADSTGMYTEEECDFDNLVGLEFPEWIVREFYKKYESEFVEETSDELDKPESECTFEDWYNEVYTADDTIDLFEFSVNHGYLPKRDDNKIIIEQTETCPYCDSENTYPNWDTDYLGYIATCNECGKKIFLCDACTHAEDNKEQKCDWHEDETGRGCFRGWIKKGE